MKLKELFVLSYKLISNSKIKYINIVFTMFLSLLLFFIATSVTLSLETIINNTTFSTVEDSTIYINHLYIDNNQYTYTPISDSDYDYLTNAQNHSVNVKYSYSSSEVKLTSGNLEMSLQRINGVDQRYDSINQKLYESYNSKQPYIIGGRDLNDSDEYSVIVNESLINENIYLGSTLTITISGNDEYSIQVNVVGVFVKYAGLTTEEYQRNPNSHSNLDYIFTKNVVESLYEAIGFTQLENYFGLLSTEISFNVSSDLVESFEYLSDKYNISSSYMDSRGYLISIKSSFGYAIIAAVGIFILTILNLINNLVLVTLHRIKFFGFLMSIGMKKMSIVLIFVFQLLMIGIIAAILSITATYLLIPLLEIIIKTQFPYYFQMGGAFTVDYMFMIVGTISSLLIINIAVIPVLLVLKKDIIKTMVVDN